MTDQNSDSTPESQSPSSSSPQESHSEQSSPQENSPRLNEQSGRTETSRSEDRQPESNREEQGGQRDTSRDTSEDTYTHKPKEAEPFWAAYSPLSEPTRTPAESQPASSAGPSETSEPASPSSTEAQPASGQPSSPASTPPSSQNEGRDRNRQGGDRRFDNRDRRGGRRDGRDRGDRPPRNDQRNQSGSQPSSQSGTEQKTDAPAEQSPRPERSEQRRDRNERPERGERERNDQRGERNFRQERERAEQGSRPERQRTEGERNDRDRPEPERNDRDRGERPQPERSDRERGDRPQRNERFDRNRRGDRNDRGDRSDRGDRGLGGSDISVVIPLLNEEGSLKELYEGLRSALGRAGKYEIIFVDDGSTDGSMKVLHDLRHRDSKIQIIRFRRNYGKSAALAAGFKHAKGEYVITMDADLQDDPNEIPSLVNELRKGYDLVSGWKKKRHDPITKTIPSRFFNFVTSVLTGIKIHDFNCGLKGYKREVVKDLNIYGELHRYIPVLASWQGFKIGEIVVRHHPRKYGKTKFGFGRFWKGFLDLLTVLFTTRYLQRPLHLFGFWGLAFFLTGFGIDLYLSIMKLFYDMSLSNRPLFTGGILLIIVGVQFISVGLIGELITKTRQSSTEEYSVKEYWK
jgi:glycosyltransferase involved in cell wall biosynthesis